MREPNSRAAVRRVSALLPLLGVFCAAACTPKQTTWPKFHHDMLQMGLSQFSTAGNGGAMKWKFTTGGAVRSSPAIANDGTVYVGSADGKLYAIDAAGAGKWTFTTGGPIDSSPAIADDGTIYVGSGDGFLYAVNPSGTQKWKLLIAGGAVHSSPAIAPSGTIYIGSNNGNIYEVSPAGVQGWTFFIFPGPSVFRSPALAADGTIYIGAESPDFFALNSSGAPKWNFTHPGNPGSTSAAVAPDGTIYVGSQDANVYALAPDGTLKWQFATGDSIWGSSPAIALDGTVSIGSTDGNVYALGAGGVLKWKLAVGARIEGSSPAIGADGTIYIGASDGGVRAISAAGTQKWKFSTAGAVNSSPAIGSDGTVYVGSDDRNLYAIGAPGSAACPLQSKQYAFTQAAGGTMKFDNLSPFAIPAGGRIVEDVGPGDASCVHEAVVPFPSGFTMAPFCVPALNFTISVVQTGCGVGRIDSNGGSDFTVSEIADTSSPAICHLPQVPFCTATPGSDNDLQVDATVGNGATDICAAPGSANAFVSIPVATTVWADVFIECPDADGRYDPGTDTLVTSFPQLLDLTTDATSTDFRDIDPDGCCIAGSGPSGSANPCTSSGPGPMTASGSCIDLSGLDAAGTDVTLVATGAVGASAPLHDISYKVTLPSEMQTVGSSSGAVCASPPPVVLGGTTTRCVDLP